MLPASIKSLLMFTRVVLVSRLITYVTQLNFLEIHLLDVLGWWCWLLRMKCARLMIVNPGYEEGNLQRYEVDSVSSGQYDGVNHPS